MGRHGEWAEANQIGPCYQMTDRVGHKIDFVNSQAPSVPGVRAVKAACTVVEHDVVLALVLKHRLDNFRRREVGLLAVRADATDEALSHRADHGRGNQERGHADVDEARDGLHGAVRVHRRQHQVPRQRRLKGNPRRLAVPDLKGVSGNPASDS